MFDIYMRSFKDALMVPFLACLKSFKFSPNYLTVLSLIYGVIGLYYISIQRRYIGFAFCLARQILDGLDGAYARATNQCSDFGGYLDIVVDFTFYGLIPLAVTTAFPSELAW
jgi:phosphatidylglycerophosphate synthase